MQTVLSTNQTADRKKLIFILVISLTLVSGIIIGGLLFTKYFRQGGGPDMNYSSFEKSQQTQKISDDRQTAVTKAISKVSSAIVGINVEEVREVQDPFFNDPFFRQFFGNVAPQRQVVRGLGSGFVISGDGYILTNDHVAGNATKISVTLTTGETVNAKLIGSDPVSDVALLKIDKNNLPFVNFGNSENAIIGEWVIALGNPFGLFEINDKPTVTVGVVSALNMKLPAEGKRAYKDMIQTDASINSGNSGGPLIDVEGNVIGMNTIIYTGGQFNQGSIGVGFAISINRVKKILEELKSKGKIERNFNPGFRIQGIDEQIAKYLNLKNKNGVVVTQVQKGSAADNAGLKPEDVIISVNGINVRSEQDLILEVNDLRLGDILNMKVIRAGDEKTIEFKLTSEK
ncbi:MAG: trypsin-like peptidase domain-containing protein [Ignavibacteriae bacterium]|jgi:serine protease Do|nr:trypsin-like peptidase domain-containing protein [Ignavibacteriota bacterium]